MYQMAVIYIFQMAQMASIVLSKALKNWLEFGFLV
jgi:hypothetical protein